MKYEKWLRRLAWGGAIVLTIGFLVEVVRHSPHFAGLNCPAIADRDTVPSWNTEEVGTNIMPTFECLAEGVESRPAAMHLAQWSGRKVFLSLHGRYAVALDEATARAKELGITPDAIAASNERRHAALEQVITVIESSGNFGHGRQYFLAAMLYAEYTEQPDSPELYEPLLREVPGLLDAANELRAAEKEGKARLLQLQREFGPRLSDAQKVTQEMLDRWGPLLTNARLSGKAIVMIVMLKDLNERQSALLTQGRYEN